MMKHLNKRFTFYLGLTGFCFLYWVADSVWSFVSFEQNLNVLIFTEPRSLMDTFLLRVSPYQIGSRLIAVCLFLISGTLLFEFLIKKQRAESALQESEEKYRTLISNSNEAIFIAQDGVFKFANPKTVQMMGYPEHRLHGTAFEDFIHPDDRQLVLDRYKDRLRGGNPPASYPIRIITQDHKTLWVQLSVTLISWEGRGASLIFLRDISEEKKLTEQLQRAEKMETVGLLAGGVAHDLNNILSGLVSYPDLLLLDLPDDSPLRGPILTMQNSGKKAALIVQDLLTLARRGIVGSDIVNLNTIITDYLATPEFFRLQSFHPHIHIETHQDQELLNIIGSPVHLSKTVMNLISNAAEACQNGGTISVTTQNIYVDKPIKGYDRVHAGDYAVIKVRDTGDGIAPEDLARIFEPFYTKKIMGRSGTGLGMAVVWGTIKDHRGYIDLESSPGHGTTVTLYFPVTRKPIDDKKPAASLEDLKGQGQTILVVDDVEEQRRICSLILTKLGYNVHTVSSGEEAVSYMQTHTADVVILDMIMDPGMDGLETYKQILLTHPGQKALIASGFSETKRVEKLQSLGAGAYIRKPYTIERIGLAVKQVLMAVR